MLTRRYKGGEVRVKLAADEFEYPIQPERIVYNKSGMHLVAARLSDRRAVIEKSLDWATAASTAEAHTCEPC
ncbi:hypothetical protein [Urbifossiella limnaea]|uniref:Uncharacterized protein n=1 Tax=Urbifossiella limnaea TaxID=2528023 RepID=A0A517Y1N6_9BACT|nr:hypothetical protein [Urbifossiella limnaea]QDU23670.1 hypothetical protein ETAA1_56750 [Urbifossiella limnaea]